MQTLKQRKLSGRRVNLIVYTMLFFYPLVGMGVDLISPSLPGITYALGTSHGFSKNLITLYLLGYMIGSFSIGFLSDSLGRKGLLLGGFAVFSGVSLLAVLIPIPSVLLIVRLLQGIAIASFGINARAIFSDLLDQARLMKFATLIATMWGIGPIIGPIIGGYLQYYFNWKAGFLFFAILGGLALLVMCFILPETHHARQPLKMKTIKGNMFVILKHRLFLGLGIIMGLAYSLLIIFNTLAPFIVQSDLGHTPIYFGRMAFLMGLAFLFGTIVCRICLKKVTPLTLFFTMITVFTLIAAASFIISLFLNMNVLTLFIPSLFMYFSVGIIYPTGMGMALSLFRELSGTNTAILNLINIGITSVAAFITSFIYIKNIAVLLLIYFLVILLAGVAGYTLVRARRSV